MHAHYLNIESLDHVDCFTGARDPGGGCDHFYSHPKSDYAGDDLNRADAITHKIFPYEIGLEYLCDLLDEGKDWVPLAVLSDAEDTARRLKIAFVDSSGQPTPPPYNCSVPFRHGVLSWLLRGIQVTENEALVSCCTDALVRRV